MKTIFLIAIIALGLLPSTVTYGGSSSWHPTDDGAVRVDAFDFLKGHIDIVAAYKQNGACTSYVRALSNNPGGGINDAIIPASIMSSKAYYYYKVSATVTFFKAGQIGFNLGLYESPSFYREPRFTPDRSQLANVIGNLSIGDQVKLTKVLKDQNGADKEFTVSQLIDTVEGVLGRQGQMFEQKLIDQFLDPEQKEFMICVPERASLKELNYGSEDEKNVRVGLGDAERTMRGLVQ